MEKYTTRVIVGLKKILNCLNMVKYYYVLKKTGKYTSNIDNNTLNLVVSKTNMLFTMTYLSKHSFIHSHSKLSIILDSDYNSTEQANFPGFTLNQLRPL